MKEIRILNALGSVDDQYIAELYTPSSAGEAGRPPKKRRLFSKIVLIAAAIALLSATAATAAEALRIRIHHHDSFTNTPAETPASGSSETDTSKAGVIEFRMDIGEEINGEPVPVLEVVPHFLTEEEVKRVAYTLFPDGVYYEAKPYFDQIYSKDEIQEKLDRWSQYATADALLELIPYRSNQPDYQQDIADTVNLFIGNYSAMYDSAPEEVPRELCDWTFKKQSYYTCSESELASRNLDNDNDEIQADIQVGDIHYRLGASIRNKDDFLINQISVCLYDGISPSALDEDIFRARLCRTEEPTDAQIAAVKEQANAMLQQMQLGSWMIDECYVEVQEINEYRNYIIHVNAVPVLNGTSALRRAQLTNLRSEDPDAPRLYYTDVQFEFSANGDLIFFKMYSPLDIQNQVTTSTAALKVEDQLEIAKKYLSEKDFYFYGMGIIVEEMDEPIGCTIEITGLEYNLTRINGEDPLKSYYYVPGIKLTGDIRYYNLESGEVYLQRENVTLIVMDGEDGSILMGH